jgi:hypothetical protein
MLFRDHTVRGSENQDPLARFFVCLNVEFKGFVGTPPVSAEFLLQSILGMTQ